RMLRILQMLVGLGVGSLILLWVWSIPVHWKDFDVHLLPVAGQGEESLQKTTDRALAERRRALWDWGQALQKRLEDGGDETATVEPTHWTSGSWQREWQELGNIDREFWVNSNPSEALMQKSLWSLSQQWQAKRPHALAEKSGSLRDMTGRRF